MGRRSLTRIAAIFLVAVLAQLDGVSPSAAQSVYPTRFEDAPEGAIVQSESGVRVVTSRDYRRKLSLVVTPLVSEDLVRMVAASDNTHITGVIKVFGAQQDGNLNGYTEVVFTGRYDIGNDFFSYFSIATTESSGNPPTAFISPAGNEMVLKAFTAANQDLMTVWIEIFANKDVTFIDLF